MCECALCQPRPCDLNGRSSAGVECNWLEVSMSMKIIPLAIHINWRRRFFFIHFADGIMSRCVVCVSISVHVLKMIRRLVLGTSCVFGGAVNRRRFSGSPSRSRHRRLLASASVANFRIILFARSSTACARAPSICSTLVGCSGEKSSSGESERGAYKQSKLLSSSHSRLVCCSIKALFHAIRVHCNARLVVSSVLCSAIASL